VTNGVALRRHLPPALLSAAIALLGLRWFGGYHPRHWTLIALALITWTCVELVRGTLPALRSPAGLALGAGIALVAWTALSITWSSYSKHLAWDETNRTAMYVATFALGAAICGSGRALARMTAWLGVGVGLMGTVVLARLVAGDDPTSLFTSARLDWPIGYSNGFAGLCLMGMWLLIGWSCAADRRNAIADIPQIHEVASGALALGGATLLALLCVLAQSRGAVLAAAISLPIAVVMFPNRNALLMRLATVGALLVALRHVLARPYETLTIQALQQADTPDLGTIRDAGHAIVYGVIAAIAVGAMLTVAHREIARRISVSSTVAMVPIALAIGTGVALLSSHSLTSWAHDQYNACAHPPKTQAASQPTSHFRELGSNRCDFWRVELNNAQAHPIIGVGANNFQGTYVLHRRSTEEPRQAHSLPLQMLGELGIVGALLFAIMGAVVINGGWKYVTSGASRDAGLAGAAACIAFWILQSSEDWLWNLPAVTLPPLLLAGGFVACVSPVQKRLHPRAVLPIAIGVGVLALASLLPQGVADRAYRAARDEAAIRTDIDTAIHNDEVAGKYDPTWAAPIIHQSQLEYRRHHFREAADLARKAVDREPENWSIRFQASSLLRASDKAAAQHELVAAHRLNPLLK
jgi:hypothetical protein